MSYHGGRFGWKALWDVFNLWDVVKAAARGFRWLFHGRKFRGRDVSYEGAKGAKLGGEDTRYGHASLGHGAIEEQEMGVMQDADSSWRTTPPPIAGKSRGESEDQQGLLSHAQSNPQASMPPIGSNRDLREANSYADVGQQGGGYQNPVSDLR